MFTKEVLNLNSLVCILHKLILCHDSLKNIKTKRAKKIGLENFSNLTQKLPRKFNWFNWCTYLLRKERSVFINPEIKDNIHIINRATLTVGLVKIGWGFLNRRAFGVIIINKKEIAMSLKLAPLPLRNNCVIISY